MIARWSGFSGWWSGGVARLIVLLVLLGLFAIGALLWDPSSVGGGGVAVVLGCAALLLVLAPRGLLAAGVGASAGFAHGVVYTLVAGMLAALIAFGIGRGLGREGVRTLAGSRWPALERWLDRNGFGAVVAARMLPLAPFGLLNYALGATSVRLRVFLPATLLGIAPSTIVYVLIGSRAAHDPGGALMLAAGFGVVVLAGAELLRRRRRRLSAHAAP